VAVPGRFSESASALRSRGLVISRRLVEAVFGAGGDPVVMWPSAPGGRVDDAEVGDRLAFADAVLLPGGGDISPEFYGAGPHESLYRMDPEQDAFDLAAARWALAAGRPLLAVCRGLQVVNVALGGTLVQDMPTHHRHVVSQLRLRPGSALRRTVGAPRITISCHHHQALDRLGEGLVATATSADGVVEATELARPDGRWFLGVQWHPEDTVATDPDQRAIFAALVAAGRDTARGLAAGSAAPPRPRG
jgi:putative glutamine amidotransferase